MSQGSPIDSAERAPEGDISLGRELRRAREVRGISVQQIAQETKINERYIHALENDRLDLLPGQPYTANFVRSIARCIGADEEELIDYLDYHLRTLQPERRDDLRGGGMPRPRTGLPIVLVLAAVVLVVALTMVFRGGDDRAGAQRQGAVERGAASTPTSALLPLATSAPGPVAAPPPGPAEASARVPPPVLSALSAASAPAPATVAAATAASAPAPTGPSAATAPVAAPTVRLVWRGRGWIEADQQGDPYVWLHEPGTEKTWTLDRPLRLEIGNSGQVDMYIDGQLAKPLGSDTETRRLSLDMRNWKSFLR